MTRSVFALTRVDDVDIFGSDEFVRYGQKVKLLSNNYLFRKPLALQSYKQTPAICSSDGKK